MLGEEQDLDQFTQQLFDRLVTATKASNDLPTDDYKYYASFRPFKGKMNGISKRLLQLAQKFMQHERPNASIMLNDTYDVDDVTEKFDEVVDFMDRLLEKVDSYAEELNGEKPKINIVVKPKIISAKQFGRFPDSNSIPRPQEKFTDVDNSEAPFIPKIVEKLHALIPLDASIVQARKGVKFFDSYPHPYEHELRVLQYPEEQMRAKPEILYKPLADTPYTWIDQPEQLRALATKLTKVSEFAVDLEHHSYRSYHGFVCLIQISTRTEDFLIDTLALRSHIHILNSSFTNPKILKVLHGADSDIVWLQRDFGVYIVNLFDTGQAARVLDYPSFGLAYLLKFYCNVDADKKYQLADWRIRDLTDEMVKYAREDTHYLLYVYDRLRNELVSRGNENNNLLTAVLNRSRDVCLKRFEKEKFDDTSNMNFYLKYTPPLNLNKQQIKVFCEVLRWRDQVARKQDESHRYVLPNQMLAFIAELMPSDIPGVLACCNPIPPLLRQHSQELVQIIAKAKEKADVAPAPIPVPQTPVQPYYEAPKHVVFTPVSTSLEKPRVIDVLSPVLTTEQLYKTAGWLETQTTGTLRTPPQSPPSSPKLMSPQPRRQAAFGEANRNLKSGTPNLFTLSDSSDSEDEGKKTAEHIRKTLSQQHGQFLSSFVPFAVGSPPSKDVTTNDAPTKDDMDESDNKNEDVRPMSQESPTANEQVPRSMAEIYKLSNKNRKRNKEKKKLKEDGTSHSSAVVVDGQDDQDVPASDDDDGNASPSKRQKGSHKKEVSGDTLEFMKEIGWLSEEAMKAAATQNEQTQTPRNTNQTAEPTTTTKAKPKKKSQPPSPQTQRRPTQQNQQSQHYAQTHQNPPINPSSSSFKPQSNAQFTPFDYSKAPSFATSHNVAHAPNAYYDPYNISNRKGGNKSNSVQHWK